MKKYFIIILTLVAFATYAAEPDKVDKVRPIGLELIQVTSEPILIIITLRPVPKKVDHYTIRKDRSVPRLTMNHNVGFEPTSSYELYNPTRGY